MARSKKKEKEKASAESRAEFQKVRKATMALVKRPLADLSCAEIDDMFTGFAEICRREGVAELKVVSEGAHDGPLKDALRLMGDGTVPEITNDVLRNGLDSILRKLEIKHLKIIEGILAIQLGTNPRLVRQKLEAIY